MAILLNLVKSFRAVSSFKLVSLQGTRAGDKCATCRGVHSLGMDNSEILQCSVNPRIGCLE